MRVLIVLLVLFCANLNAQEVYKSHRRDREISFRYDNDVLFISDQYYTSGGELSFAVLTDSIGVINKIFRTKFDKRVIVKFNYGHKIFNSKKIKEQDLMLRDRPFAGWHYARVSVINSTSVKSLNKYSVELGLVGPNSGIGNFQKWWHRTGGIVTPEGWDQEIQDEVIVNIGYERLQDIMISKKSDIIGESNLTLGNGLTSLFQQFTLRVGKINSINNTAYCGNRLNRELPEIGSFDVEQEEIFFFYGIRGEYVIQNIFIEGSLFNNKSPLTRDEENFLLTQTFGVMYSNYYTTFKIIFNRLSPEVVGGDSHRFVSFELGLRF